MEKAEVLAKIGEGLKAIPSLGKLLLRLSRDPRVPKRSKLIFGSVAAYLFLPVDFIPDWIPGLGHVDDLALIALGLDAMLNQVPKDVLSEHWEGDQEQLEKVKSILGMVTKFVPGPLKQKLYSSEAPQEAPNEEVN